MVIKDKEEPEEEELGFQKFQLTDKIAIGVNDRIAIFGRTGTGKTYFSKKVLLPHYPRLVFHDIKHENNDFAHDVILTTPKELEENIHKYNKILYQPDDVELGDFNEVCKIIFEAKNTALYVDEIAAVSASNRIEAYHRLLLTQGRSKNEGLIQVSQRPRDLYNTIISESEHLFVFKLSLDTDISKLRFMLGDGADEIKTLPYFHFIYLNSRDNILKLFSPAKIDKEGKITLEEWRPTLEEYLLLQR